MGYKKRTDIVTDKITDSNDEIMPEAVPMPEPENIQEVDETRRGLSDYEDEITRRKQEIADKRRASLALARTKIVPKSALKKQAEEVIKNKDELLKNKQEETDAMKLKYERDRIKTLEDNLMALQKLIADKPSPVPVPVVEVPVPVVEVPKRKQRPSRSKEALAQRAIERHQAQDASDIPEPRSRGNQPQQIIPKKSVEPRMVAQPIATEKLIDKSYSEQLQERLRSQAINKIMNDTFGGF